MLGRKICRRFDAVRDGECQTTLGRVHHGKLVWENCCKLVEDVYRKFSMKKKRSKLTNRLSRECDYEGDLKSRIKYSEVCCLNHLLST